MADAVLKCRSCLTPVPQGSNTCPHCGPLVRCPRCEALVKHGAPECPGCKLHLDALPVARSRDGSAWLEWATRTTAVLAVLAALSSGQYGDRNLRAILEQGKVNDKWAQFQAKSIKQHGAEDAASLGKALSGGRDASPELAAFIKTMSDESVRLSNDKEIMTKEAEALEDSRDHIVTQSFWFQVAFACLQVGVVLCTIASAAKRRLIWGASILAGVLGLTVLANGFLGFVPAPAQMTRKLASNLDANTKTPAPAAPTPSPSTTDDPGSPREDRRGR